jgi:hypothetical protein
LISYDLAVHVLAKVGGFVGKAGKVTEPDGAATNAPAPPESGDRDQRPAHATPDGKPGTEAEAEAETERRRRRNRLLLVAYAVVAVAGLIVLRALVDALGFISLGWILVLAALPVLPWLLPLLGDFLKAIRPFVQSVSLGALKVDLRSVRREPIAVAGASFTDVPNDFNALSQGTRIKDLVLALQKVRLAGGWPIGVIDLRDGRWWKLPNLYFLSRILEIEPIVSQLVFTEAHNGTDGYFVATCRPGELRRHIEQTNRQYADASRNLQFPSKLDLFDAQQAQQLGNAFQNFLGPPPASPPPDDDPVQGYVTPERIRTPALGLISTTSIEATTATLTDDQVRTALNAPYPFVPATTAGHLTGLIDRESVALTVARAAAAQAG